MNEKQLHALAAEFAKNLKVTVTAPLNRNLSRKTKPASQEWMSRLLPYMPRG
ncbi:putative transposase [Glaesserella parasuis]|nr:putative transposase [Glaesserella parasuis]